MVLAGSAEALGVWVGAEGPVEGKAWRGVPEFWPGSAGDE